jgi:hypothetical protein
MSQILKSKGSPATASAKTCKCGAANGIDTVYEEKANRVPGDLLARTIACQPPNEARIRGIVV